MAQEILVFSVGEIMKKLISMLAEEIGLSWGFEEELRGLRVSATMIESVLQDAEEKQAGNRAIGIWLRRLRDAAYEAEDVFDEIAYEILPRKLKIRSRFMNKVGGFFSSNNPIAFRVNMAHKIRDVNRLLEDIRRDGAAFGFVARTEGSGTGSTLHCRKVMETDSFLNGSEVVGREDDVSRILEMLVNPSDEGSKGISFVHVVGMAGLGKTSLAKMVCLEVKEMELFDVTTWVCVSDGFDERRILGAMLESINEDCSGVGVDNLDSMLVRLQKKLREKRFLLVLDDAWNQNSVEWVSLTDRLLKIHRCEGNGVLVTTRADHLDSLVKRDVSLYESVSMHKYYPSGLSTEECWAIIKNRVLGKQVMELPYELDAIGRGIAENCGGLPLLARVVGGAMGFKVDKNEWLEIKNSQAWDSEKFSDGILPILKLSFDRLPSTSLKQCFAYCAVFPKDFEFEKEILVQLWVAEGLIRPYERRNLEMVSVEDSGNEHFSFLLANGFFQDAEFDKFGNVVSCRMHDAMQDLARHVSRFDMSSVQRVNLLHGTEISEQIRKDSSRKLRAVFSKTDVFDKNTSGSLKRLRVLDLSASCIWSLPSWIGKLKHLRYLDISGTPVSYLPESIAKLYNLLTLRLLRCIFLLELPKGIENLINLMHIYFDEPWLTPFHVGRLTNLRTLPMFEVGTTEGRGIGELGSLNHLKGRLEITKLENVRDKDQAARANICKKPDLHHLVFEWSDENEAGNGNDVDVLEGLQPHQNLQRLEICRFKGKNFPPWFCNPSKLSQLVELTLDADNIDEFPALGELPSLAFLKISSRRVKRIGYEFYSNAHKACSCNHGITQFPSLRELELHFMSSLEEWIIPASPNVFSCLERLRIENCPKLRSIAVSSSPAIEGLRTGDLCIRALPMTLLERIDIWCCPKLKHFPDMHHLTFLQRFDIMHSGLSCLPSGLQHCKSLRFFTIFECPNLVSIPDSLREVSSLVSLSITNCCSLTHFPGESLQDLRCLEKLEIGGFSDELKEFPDLHFDKDLNLSIRELTVIGWNTLTSFPGQIQHLTSLTDLKIQYFICIEALPEWLGNLTYLRSLCVMYCLRLRHFPSAEAMQRLGNLHSVEIVYCPWLEKRCAENIGPEWFKVPHIPSVVFESIHTDRIRSDL